MPRLTQQELAVRAGVALRSVARWEAGKAEPRNAQLEALARVLDVRAEDLRGVPEDEAAMAGAVDVLARLLAESLHGALGEQLIRTTKGRRIPLASMAAAPNEKGF